MCCSGVIGVASKCCRWCSTWCTVAVVLSQRACPACLLLAAAVQCVAAVASSKCLVRLGCTGDHQARAGLLPTAQPVHLRGSMDEFQQQQQQQQQGQQQQQQQQQQQGVSSPRSAMQVCQSPPSAVRARLDLQRIRFMYVVQRTQLLSSQADASPCEAAGVTAPGLVRNVGHSPPKASKHTRHAIQVYLWCSPCEAAGVRAPGSVRNVSHSPASASSPARPTSSWYHQGRPFSLQQTGTTSRGGVELGSRHM
jgi:hypothetical protein